MVYKFLTLIFCTTLAGFSVAQTDTNTIIKDDVHQGYYNVLPQRHVTADLVMQVVNINADRKPVLIVYHNDPETMKMAAELRAELLVYELDVKPLQTADTNLPVNNPKHNNFTYVDTDSMFIITAHSRGK